VWAPLGLLFLVTQHTFRNPSVSCVYWYNKNAIGLRHFQGGGVA